VIIKKLDIQSVKVPLEKPIPSGKMVIKTVDALLVSLYTDDLHGEGMVFTLNGTRLSIIKEMILSLEELVIGVDVDNRDDFLKRTWSELVFLGQRGIGAIALSAIDMALWDLAGKERNQNISHMLGSTRVSMPIYRSGSLRLSASIDELQQESQVLTSQGFKAIKMSLGSKQIDDDVARVRAVRQAIGFDVQLMTDCNQQLTVSHAIELGNRLEEFALAWIEEPIVFHDHAGEAEIAKALNTPIASGENEFTSHGMLEMMERQSADILMPDLQRMGGPTELLKVGQMAFTRNIPIAPHLFTQMSLPLAAAMPNAIYVEYMPWFSPLYNEQLILNAAGEVPVPRGPGWGFNFDQQAIKKYAYF
jgi:L-alanine-DL-glutamate epimerase-like enolase superfamily enzyme